MLSVLSKIRWRSVAIVVGLLIVVAVLFKSLPTSYKTGEDISIRSWADPDKVELNGKTTIWVEVKNVGENEINVTLNVSAYSSSLVFSDPQVETVSLGPGEQRNVDFRARLEEAKYGGDYRIDINAYKDKTSGVTDTIYITVED